MRHLTAKPSGATPLTADAAMAAALGRLSTVPCHVVHLIGNHELYNFPRESLLSRLRGHGHGGRMYHSFSPAAGFRVLALDPFEVSVMGLPATDQRYHRALEVLAAHNPNDCTKPGNWMRGLEGEARRFVPFNGAMGQTQLAWLSAELEAAKAASQRVLVLSHAPLSPRACDGTTMAWDFDRALAALNACGCVVAVLAGHNHKAGYFRDGANGIHHITLASPLNKGRAGSAFGAVRARADGLELVGPALVDLLPRDGSPDAGGTVPPARQLPGGLQSVYFPFPRGLDSHAHGS